jgi:hypothetical protein
MDVTPRLMSVILYILIGIIVGYVGKDLLTTESQIVYHIKRLRAKKGGEIHVDAEAIAVKQKLTRREKKALRKNKK